MRMTPVGKVSNGKTFYDITPIAKPRMTQRDKWAKRPAVLRYRAFCDEVRSAGVSIPAGGWHATFVMPMPKSWNAKKRSAMLGKPHQQKPDIDNLAKALMDATHEDDSHIWDCRLTKVWGERGQINIVSSDK